MSARAKLQINIIWNSPADGCGAHDLCPAKGCEPAVAKKQDDLVDVVEDGVFTDDRLDVVQDRIWQNWLNRKRVSCLQSPLNGDLWLALDVKQRLSRSAFELIAAGVGKPSSLLLAMAFPTDLFASAICH